MRSRCPSRDVLTYINGMPHVARSLPEDDLCGDFGRTFVIRESCSWKVAKDKIISLDLSCNYHKFCMRSTALAISIFVIFMDA